MVSGPVSAIFAAGQVPQNFSVLRQTNAGMLMITAKAQVPSLAAASEATLNDLDDFFDDDYVISDSFEDQKTHATLLTGLRAKYHGQVVRGIVMARKANGGANVFVAFVNDNADRNAWAALTAHNAPPEAANPLDPATPVPPQPAALPEQVPLREYRFPDNTGSIGIAPGYSTNAASCGSMFQVLGQGGQELTFGCTLSVNVPNSTAVQMARQFPTAYNNTMLVAPYTDPVSAINALFPQLSRISVMQGQYATTIDHLRKICDAPPVLQNQTAAVATYGATRSQRGRNQHFQVLALVSVTPISNQAYMFIATSLAAPDATFRQDLPAMLAMAGSIHENAAQIQYNTQVWIDQRKIWFTGVEKANDTVEKAGDGLVHNMEKNSDLALKSVTDFDETIRGERTVQDTVTGEKTQVNLGNVDDVVYELNKIEPGRFVQIKLRDQ